MKLQFLWESGSPRAVQAQGIVSAQHAEYMCCFVTICLSENSFMLLLSTVMVVT